MMASSRTRSLTLPDCKLLPARTRSRLSKPIVDCFEFLILRNAMHVVLSIVQQHFYPFSV